MTPWHYRWLCRFAYINLPEGMEGRTLCCTARELERMADSGEAACGGPGAEEREALRVIADTPELGGLVLKRYVNRSSGSGLAACLLESENGELHMIFRGSELRGCGAPTGVDWLDNFAAPFQGSVQYPEIYGLARGLAEGPVTFSGHSKGAHNALYALAVSRGDRARAIVFNGQGFAPGQLTGDQKNRLSSRAVNYVTQGDLVGSLLWHPEKRVFVKRRGAGSAHALSAFEFDGQGNPVPARRPLWSYALEWATRRYVKAVVPPEKRLLPNMEML